MTSQYLRQVFDAFDQNHDGLLTIDELTDWLHKMGLHASREGMLRIMDSCDGDKDGRLNFAEFEALTRMLEKEEEDQEPNTSSSDLQDPKEMEMKAAFRVFDKDGNGLISPKELEATLLDLGLLAAGTNLARVESMIRKVDTDGDGEVNFSEFQSMMKGT